MHWNAFSLSCFLIFFLWYALERSLGVKMGVPPHILALHSFQGCYLPYGSGPNYVSRPLLMFSNKGLISDQYSQDWHKNFLRCWTITCNSTLSQSHQCSIKNNAPGIHHSVRLSRNSHARNVLQNGVRCGYLLAIIGSNATVTPLRKAFTYIYTECQKKLIASSEDIH